MIFTPDAEATSAIKLTSRPISIGQGSTKVSSPKSRTSFSRSTQFLSAAFRSNFGAAQSSSQPAHPISRCSCISVVPSCSGLVVPVTVLIVFIATHSPAGCDYPAIEISILEKLDPTRQRRQTVRNQSSYLIGDNGAEIRPLGEGVSPFRRRIRRRSPRE